MAALAKGMPYYGTVCYAYCDTVCYAMPGTVRRMLCRVQYCFCYAMPYSRSNQTASSPSRDLPPCRQQPAVIKCFLRAVMDHCPRLAYLNMAGNTIAHEGASHLVQLSPPITCEIKRDLCTFCTRNAGACSSVLCAYLIGAPDVLPYVRCGTYSPTAVCRTD